MNHIDVACRHAADLADVDRYAEAETTVRTALHRAPTDPRLLTMLGYLLHQQERHLDALAACDAAVAAAPDHGDAHTQRAWILIDIHRTADAITAATEAVRLDPHLADRHLALAEALADDDRFDEARNTAQHALELAPRSAAALLSLAGIERLAGNLDTARDATRQALAIDPASTRGRQLLALLDADQNKVRRSMRTLTDVARDQPAHPDLDSLVWPIRRTVVAPRRWLPAAAGLTAGIGLAAALLDNHAAGTAARGAAALAAAATVSYALRILLPAGRLPWQTLRLAPALVRRSLAIGLATITTAAGLLAGYAAGGPLLLPSITIAAAPILWTCMMAESLGHHLANAGDRQFLQDWHAEVSDLLRQLRRWPAQTRRELRASWHAGDTAEQERKQRQAALRRPLAVYQDRPRNNLLCAAFGLVTVLATLAAVASRPSTGATTGFGLFALLMLYRCIRVRTMRVIACPEGLLLYGTVSTFIVPWGQVAKVTGDDSVAVPTLLRSPVLVLTNGRRLRIKQAAFYDLGLHNRHDLNARVHQTVAELETIRLAAARQLYKADAPTA